MDGGKQTRPDVVPPLREGLAIVEHEEAGGPVIRIVEGTSGRGIRLDPRGREVAQLLDAPQPFEVLLDRIAKTGRPMAPEALRRVLRAFEGLGLLAAAEPGPSGASAGTHGEPVPLLIPEDMRFTCTGCGSCCLGVNVGPVGAEVAHGIRGRIADLAAEDGATGRAPFFSMVPEGEDEEVLVCQTRNGGCTFLDPDGLCRIHRRLGAAAKPVICRLFPFRFVWTPDGVRVGLQLECRDILRASTGQKVREQEAELREVLALLPKIPTVRPHLSVDGETTLTYPEYLALEAEILAAIDRAADRGGWAMLIEAWRVLSARCREGFGPDSDPDLDSLRIGFYSLLRDVGETLVTLKQRYYEEGERIRFHTGNLDIVVESLTDAPLFTRLILTDEPGESARFARILFANYWRSREESFGPPDLVTSFAELAFSWFLTRAVAVSRARQVHRFFLTPQDLVDGWVLVHMLLRNHRIREAFMRLRDRLIETFGYRLESLERHRVGLEQVSPKTDFYLF